MGYNQRIIVLKRGALLLRQSNKWGTKTTQVCYGEWAEAAAPTKAEMVQVLRWAGLGTGYALTPEKDHLRMSDIVSAKQVS